MYDPEAISVVILAGGRGARFDHESQVVPKPLIEVAGKPMLGHIMDLYEAQGFRRFIVLGGYKWELVHQYMATRYECSDLPRDYIRCYGDRGGQVVSHLFDTGIDASTGDRLIELAWDMMPTPEFLGGSDFYLLTYGDGLCDVSIHDLIETHLTNRHFKPNERRDPIVTLTAVNPPGRFGVIDFEDKDELAHGRIDRFTEKGADEWINGGFMVVDQGAVIRYVPKEPWAQRPHESFETGALPRMAWDGNLFGYKHDGYWRCMDTRRDLERIEQDVKENGGKLPWLRD